MSKIAIYAMIAFQSLIMAMASESTAQRKLLEEIQVQIESNSGSKSLPDVIKEIEAKGEFTFAYSKRDLKGKKILLAKTDWTMESLLKEISVQGKFSIRRVNETITLNPVGIQELPDVGEQVTVQHTVSGKITDENGESLPGASVIVKGTTNGTTTDIDGQYQLNCSEDDVLTFSFVGYETQEMAVDNRSVMDIKLNVDAEQLEEVVVVGYGTQGRRTVTGAISNLSAEEFKDIPAVSSGEMMKGRMSGVSVRIPDGQPGTVPQIRVRGISSVGAGDNPLIVIDGFPVGNTIPESLNPGDIESFTILKDASSTAIYGARGSNGVVVITTKKGRANQSNLQFHTHVGFQSVPESRRFEVLNAREYAFYMKETMEEQAAASGSTVNVPEIYENWEQYGEGTDWQDEMLVANAPLQNYAISYSGGNDKIRGAMSGSYTKQDGVLPYTDFERYAYTTNVDADLNDFIRAGVNIRASRSVTNGSFWLGNNWQRNIMNFAYMQSPLQSPYDENGELIPLIDERQFANRYLNQMNPIWVLKNNIHETTRNDIYSGAFVEVSFLNAFTFKSSLNGSVYGSKFEGWKQNYVGGGSAWLREDLSEAFYETNDRFNWNIDNLLTYENNFGEHFLKLLVGQTAQKYQSWSSSQSARDFTSDDVKTIQAGAIPGANSTGSTAWSLAGYFARLNYNFKEKYLIEATFRREGSSRFGVDNRWGNFPSVGLGWRLSDEAFFPKTFINDLKLRTSFGITGNNNIGNFEQYSNIASYDYTFNGAVVQGSRLAGYANPLLGWEISEQLDLGIVFSMFNYRLNVNTTYFHKITRDMLFNVPLPSTTGFTNSFDNVGKVENHGFEFELQTENFVEAFRWTTNFNATWVTNKVMELNTEGDEIITGGRHITKVGEEIGAFYGYQQIGIYTTQEDLDMYPASRPNAHKLGALIYQDANEDGVIDSFDRIVIGSPQPDWILGMTNTFSYASFDLSVLMTSALGYSLFNNAGGGHYNMVQRINVSAEVIDRWRSSDNPGAGKLGSSTINAQNREWGSLMLQKADHLWVKNITLGWTLPPSIIESKNLPFKSVRIYSSVQNAFLYAPGVLESNPEASLNGGGENGDSKGIGTALANYPVPRTITFGLNVNF